MDLAYHRKCITDAYNIASFAESHQRILDRNTIKVLTGFVREALRHEGFDQTPEMAKIRPLAAILQDHYSVQSKEYTFSSMLH